MVHPDPGEQPTIAEWLEALSSRSVSPAAGSAAALTAALGTALLVKLARWTPDEDVRGHKELLDELVSARDRLLALAASDAWANTAWASTRARHVDDEERQAALRMLIQVPLEAAELCREVCLAAQDLVETGHPPARPDGHVGMELLRTSQESLRGLVEINVLHAQDDPLVNGLQERLERLRED